MAGKPIHHTLSPPDVLVSSHMRQQGLDLEIVEMRLLNSDDVNDPMAWAWVTKVLFKQKLAIVCVAIFPILNPLRLMGIMEEIVKSDVEIESELMPFGESFISSPTSSKTVRGQTNHGFRPVH